MRHDAHYVEELTQERVGHVGRLIPIDKLDPNPNQPRTEIGDLTELTASIREKGVLEPLLVRPMLMGRWMIIAGERRWRAATTAGLTEVPCIEMDVDDSAVAEIALIKAGGTWRQATARDQAGLRKKHGLQGPIDDAFLEPFLCVRPTGTPWNPAAHQQALRELEHFDRIHAKYLRGHVRVKDDKEVTEADLKRYHVVLFGDPGSNRLIARLNGKLPLRWTRQTITLGDRTFPSAESLPLMIYPNPLDPAHYVILNSGLTVQDREYPASDYLTPLYGDFAVLKVSPEAGPPEVQCAGLFDEQWKLKLPAPSR